MDKPSNNPYQVGRAPDPSGGESFITQFKAAKKDQESNSKAPQNLPYPLQTIVDDIGNVFVMMIQIKDKFHRAKLASKHTTKLEQIQQNIDDINKQIFKLTDHLYDLK